MAGPDHPRNQDGAPRPRHAMVTDLPQQPSEHGHRRHPPRHDAENGCASSTDAPRQERGDYPLINAVHLSGGYGMDRASPAAGSDRCIDGGLPWAARHLRRCRPSLPKHPESRAVESTDQLKIQKQHLGEMGPS